MFGAHAEGLHPHQADDSVDRKTSPGGVFFFWWLDAVFSGEVHGKLG